MIFANVFFQPSFGVRFAGIIAWIDTLIKVVEGRAGDAADEGFVIRRDVERLRDRFVDNPFALESIRSEGRAIQLEERIIANGDRFQRLYVFSLEELEQDLTLLSKELTDLLAISPGQVSLDFKYPHEENPLEFKTLITLPDRSYLFLDLANAYRIVAKMMERQICRLTPSGIAI